MDWVSVLCSERTKGYANEKKSRSAASTDALEYRRGVNL